MVDNILLFVDSYKATHWRQYPPKTEKVYSYFECRGGKFTNSVFFGLQYILQRHLEGRIVTNEKIAEAKALFDLHFGRSGLFNVDGWRYIVDRHKGKLPISIKAVPEGTEVPTGNVLMTIENTDPKCFWLPGYLETCLLQLWYPMTVSTQSNEFWKLWMTYLERNGTPESIDFKLHDFGCRGVSSNESAALGGLAHLLVFKGTDTVPALVAAQKYYDSAIAGYSIPASEHSTITAWGRHNEVEAYENMLTQYPTGLMACVSDSYNVYDAVSKIWGGVLKDKVLARDGVLVVRPDSGHPQDVVLDVVRRLGSCFGYEYNGKHIPGKDDRYKVLNPKVRVIQGDGIDLDTAEAILHKLDEWGWSADNIAMGSGGALLQKLNRDTLKCAIKASLVTIDMVEQPINKSPITDGGKKSKSGRLKLLKDDRGRFYTKSQSDCKSENERHDFKLMYDELVEVFRDGEIKKRYTLEDCRKRLQETRILSNTSYVHPEQWCGTGRIK